MGARYYDSWRGQWGQVDPLADLFQGWSSYNYVQDNPIKTIDHDGRGDPTGVSEATILAISGLAILTAVTIHTYEYTFNSAYRSRYNSYESSTAHLITNSVKKIGNYIGNLFNSSENKTAPPANNGEAPQHGSEDHDKAINDQAEKNKQEGHTDIRKNQVQVDANGNVVGKNRPDLQSTDPNGKRHTYEYDKSQKRSDAHVSKIKGNDPNTEIHTKILEK